MRSWMKATISMSMMQLLSEAAEEISTEATESTETLDEAILSSDMTADDYENVEFDENS